MPTVPSLRTHTDDELMYVHDGAVLLTRRESDPDKLCYLEEIITACSTEEERRDAEALVQCGGFVVGVLEAIEETSKKWKARPPK